MISATGRTSHLVDAAGDLAAERDRRLHVAAEVEVLRRRAELGHRTWGSSARAARSALGAQRAQAGAGENRFRNTVSVSAAPTIASASSSRAPATRPPTPCGCPSARPRRRGRTRRPSTARRDAAGGDDRHVDLRAHERQQHHRGHVARVLEAAALAALDDEAVDAGLDRLQRPASVGTTWNTVSPAAFSCAVYLVGSPAEVVTNARPGRRRSRRSRVAHEGLGDVHAERLVGEVAHLADLVAHASSSPDDVSMMPSPPAFDTADASWARAIQPIGACTIG
jgi:hypothetical protein